MHVDAKMKEFRKRSTTSADQNLNRVQMHMSCIYVCLCIYMSLYVAYGREFCGFSKYKKMQFITLKFILLMSSLEGKLQKKPLHPMTLKNVVFWAF